MLRALVSNAVKIKSVIRARSMAISSGSPAIKTDYSSVDHIFERDRIRKENREENSRDFTYFLLGADRIFFASLARLTLIKVNLYCNSLILKL